MGRGKRERGPRGTCSPPRFGPVRSEEVGPRRRAASTRGDRGGGAAGWEGGHAVAEVVVGVEGRAEGPFYRSSGARERGRGWPARTASSAAINGGGGAAVALSDGGQA